MFFQGQEFAASTPFLYFADFSGNDAKAVAEGRIQFLSQFPSLATEEAQRAMADPANRATFERSKLDWSERDTHRHMYDLHSDLLKLRREDEVFRRQRADRIEGSALGADCLVLRYFGHDVDEPVSDRLVVVNFGRQFCYSPSPEPLLAPPPGSRWEILVVKRGRALRRVRHAADSRPTTAGTFRRRRRSCSKPAIDDWHIPPIERPNRRGLSRCRKMYWMNRSSSR